MASGFYSEAPLETVQRYEKSRVSVRLQDANLIASRLLEMEEEEEEYAFVLFCFVFLIVNTEDNKI